MNTFILAWIFVAGNSNFQSYSPPVKTREQCVAIQQSMATNTTGRCVQVEVLLTK